MTLNTEFDIVCLCPCHVQMTRFGVCPLGCLFSEWYGQGFYVELFFIVAFPSQLAIKMEKAGMKEYRVEKTNRPGLK